MRHAYAHDAVLDLPSDADLAAPGAAITSALCGHWEHPPPCPLAPHHTATRRDGTDVHLRILFATEPEREDEVRARIGAALTAWNVRSTHSAPVRPDERAHVGRLAGSPS